uniref:Uncharacterized protein n=1 Tax=Schistosoma mansoni TaxID=6183 RepID=A0AA82N7W8_SCHMA
MALTSDQFQLLIQRQEQRFRKSQLEFIDKLHAKLLNHPCFGGETEVDAIISKLRTELENDYKTNEYAGESLNESVQNSNLNAAVIHDQPSSSVLPVSDTCPVHGPSLINPENGRANSELSYSQKVNVLQNAHEIAAVPAHEETGNKSSSILNTVWRQMILIMIRKMFLMNLMIKIL